MEKRLVVYEGESFELWGKTQAPFANTYNIHFFSCCVWERGGGGCLLKNNGGCDKICVYPVMHVCGMHMYRSVFAGNRKEDLLKIPRTVAACSCDFVG